MLLKVALLNIVLAMFNLIPIPPLDGSHLFKYLLPQELRRGYEKLGRSGVGFIILIIVINMPDYGMYSTKCCSVAEFPVEDLYLFLMAYRGTVKKYPVYHVFNQDIPEMKIKYNSPVILTYTIISITVLFLSFSSAVAGIIYFSASLSFLTRYFISGCFPMLSAMQGGPT